MNSAFIIPKEFARRDVVIVQPSQTDKPSRKIANTNMLELRVQYKMNNGPKGV